MFFWSREIMQMYYHIQTQITQLLSWMTYLKIHEIQRTLSCFADSRIISEIVHTDSYPKPHPKLQEKVIMYH